MRYYWTDFGTKGWQVSDLNDPLSIIESHYNELWVYDCDYGGDDKSYFAFENGEYYKLVHSWGFEDWNTENLYVYNEFDVEKVEKKDTKGLISDRDWIFPSTNSWYAMQHDHKYGHDMDI